MAKKKASAINTIPNETIITVVARSGKKQVVKNMTYGEAKALLKKRNSWSYIFYQKGFTNLKSN